MNRKYKRRLVKAMYKVHDSPTLDEYGSRIFGALNVLKKKCRRIFSDSKPPMGLFKFLTEEFCAKITL